MYDDEFTTVDYLESLETPFSWRNLVQNSCEKVTNKQYDTARTWYEGGNAIEELSDEDSDDSDTYCNQTRELIPSKQPTPPLITNTKEYENTRDPPTLISSLSKKTR